MNESSDFDLLQAYATRRSEEAFRTLVARHADLVYSAAMRQLRNPHLAEEATQAAFLALAAKAGRLGRRTVVSGWLHRAVHFAGLKLLRSEVRRRRWEGEAAATLAAAEPERAFEELALPQVDSALAELGDHDRDALLLRFLQQKSHREVADALGTSEEAAKKRVHRALERLRAVLAGRGIALPATVLATGLTQMPVKAAPATLPGTLAARVVEAGFPVSTDGGGVLDFLAGAAPRLACASGLVLVAVGSFLLLHLHAANGRPASTFKIRLNSVLVDDQAKALAFYTDVLGFTKKSDLPMGTARWLTVTSPLEPDGPELVLEPMGFAPARTYQKALFDAGIPLTAFAVEDVRLEHDRLKARGVVFPQEPTSMGPVTVAVFEDTCGNRIQMVQPPRRGDGAPRPGLRIRTASVLVEDQTRALAFYTEVLGFALKTDVPVGDHRWLTVVSPREPDGPELLLEPMGFAPARTYQSELRKAGIPLTAFAVDDVRKEHQRLAGLGVNFTVEPRQAGAVTMAVFEDTCGNLIQIFAPR